LAFILLSIHCHYVIQETLLKSVNPNDCGIIDTEFYVFA